MIGPTPQKHILLARKVGVGRIMRIMKVVMATGVTRVAYWDDEVN
jgi:translation elongation factor EF-Tu-like GTPase